MLMYLAELKQNALYVSNIVYGCLVAQQWVLCLLSAVPENRECQLAEAVAGCGWRKNVE